MPRPDGIPGSLLLGPFPVGQYAAKLQVKLREIARVQLWQWLHAADGGHAPLYLADGSVIDGVLFEQVLLNLPSRLAAQGPIPGAQRVADAIGMLEELTRSEVLEEFLTLPAYERLG